MNTVPSSLSVRRAPGIQLRPIEEALLSRVRGNDTDIVVEQAFRTGFSGAVVLLVSFDHNQAPSVVKIAPSAEIAREYAAYHQFVKRALPQNTAHLEGEPLYMAAVEREEFGLLHYTFAGGNERRPARSLHDYFWTRGGDKTIAVLKRVFREYGLHWWAHNLPERCTISQHYDHLLPPHLTLEATTLSQGVVQVLEAGKTSVITMRKLGMGQTVQLRGFRIEKVRSHTHSLTLSAAPPVGELSPPLRLSLTWEQAPAYQPGDVLDEIAAVITATRQQALATAVQAAVPDFDPSAQLFLAEQWSREIAGTLIQPRNPVLEVDALLDRVVNMRISTIHGDLNLQNVLVDDTIGFAWLIDFADVSKGPAFFDLQRLEVQVITKLLPQVVADAQLALTVACELLVALHADHPSLRAPHSALQEPYTVLVGLRRLARQYLMNDFDWDEYYAGLIIKLLGTLKFRELDATAHGLAVTTAATAQALLGVELETATPEAAVIASVQETITIPAPPPTGLPAPSGGLRGARPRTRLLCREAGVDRTGRDQWYGRRRQNSLSHHANS